jgi:hypothetical protein
MPTDQAGRLQTDHEVVAASRWRDRKRYLWLLGLIIPALVVTSWLAVQATGLGVFWWAGPLLMSGIIPMLDYLVGPDSENPPESVLAWLENDPYYRRATYLYLPTQYLSLVLACWLWSGGGWLTMGWIDKIGLMLTVGGIGGVAINTLMSWGTRGRRPRNGSARWHSRRPATGISLSSTTVDTICGSPPRRTRPAHDWVRACTPLFHARCWAVCARHGTSNADASNARRSLDGPSRTTCSMPG